MPSQSSKSPLAPSTKTHSFLRKSTDESPLNKTTSTSVPSEVRTSQSTNSLSPRSNESNHPEEDDDVFDDDKSPEEKAAADLRANRHRGHDPNSSIDENNTSFLSGVGSSVSSTPSLERAIKKKKVIRMSLARLSRLCTERANPQLHQFSSTKTLVERLYSSVLLT